MKLLQGIGFFTLILTLTEVMSLESWITQCHPPCICDVSYFIDLPMAQRWPQQSRQILNGEGNEATYQADTRPDERGDLMMMAICVLQEGIDTRQLLSKLPSDIQALTILQGRASNGITSLNSEDFKQFHQLTVLDIQGIYPNQFLLSNNALLTLGNLQYLNLEALTFENKPQFQPKFHDPNSNLIFLQPDINEQDIVPYQEYNERALDQNYRHTFVERSKLMYMRVFGCNLDQVNWEMFQGLDHLQHLSLENNNLLFLPDFTFYGNPHLKTLSLSGNQLLSLQDTALVGLFELEKLDLSNNNFSHLSELSLPPLPKLRIADFRQNPVATVFPSTFEIMNATSILYIGSDNSPINLIPNSFIGLTSLKELYITNANVFLLEKELLNGMPQLFILYITGNIPSLSFDAFLRVPKLEQLALKKCNISSISMDAFYGLSDLLTLDLSNNLLTSLPPGIFDKQASLRELYLQNNQLTELPSRIFQNVPAKMVRLELNPWHCSCDMREWQSQASFINKMKTVNKTYVYEKKISPRCMSPTKYKDWDVFHFLRKALHCNEQKTTHVPVITEKSKILKEDAVVAKAEEKVKPFSKQAWKKELKKKRQEKLSQTQFF